MNYTPFKVAPYVEGTSKYLKPWLTPNDALVDLQDCFTYRGCIQKRQGYELYDNFPEGPGIFVLGTGDGTTTAFMGTLDNTPVGMKSLAITHYNAGVLVTDGTDDGAGNITGTNIAAGSTIDYATGAITINFTAAPTIYKGILVEYGIHIGTGTSIDGPYAFSLPNTLISLRSVVVGAATATVKTSATPFEAPATDGLTGDLTGNQVTAGTITYATGAITGLTFNDSIGTNDVWAKFQYQAASEPIKGIQTYVDSTGSFDTLVFNNTEAAIFDDTNFKLTNISGPGYFSGTSNSQNFYSTAGAQGKMFILNNIDPLTIWDGVVLAQPTFPVTGSQNLTTGLHLFWFRNRMIILRPSFNGVIQPQTALYSAINNPFNFRTDQLKAGGLAVAPTADWIISAEFLRDELIVNFQYSTWKLRYTGIDTNPFRWQKINDTRSVDSPYAALSFQNFVTAVGTTGLLRTDGVNTERYDDKIINFTQDDIDAGRMDIINTYRHDPDNQQLLCYPSEDFPDTQFSDKWLVWNFLENSFAVFNIPTTCFGSFVRQQDLTWEDFNAANGMDWSWDEFPQESTWLSFFSTRGSRIPVFGTETGQVMTYGDFTTDNGTKFGFSFTTKDFNPFVDQGMQARLGYIDFYFDRPTAENVTDTDYLLTIDLFKNEDDTPYKTVVFNPYDSDFIHKRIFSGEVANFHRFKIYLSDDQIQNSTVAEQGFTLNSYILYMQPAGRIIG